MDEPTRQDDNKTSRRAPRESEASGIAQGGRELVPTCTGGAVEIEVRRDETASGSGQDVQEVAPRRTRLQPRVEIPTTELQRRFVKEFLKNGGKIVEAYKKVRATKKKRTPTELVNLARQLRDSAGVQYLLNLAEERKSTEVGPVIAKYAINEARIAEELAKIAFSNPKEVMKWGPDGVVLKNSDELSDSVAGSISEVSATSSKSGTSVRVKQYDKVQALLTLGKSLGMFKEEKSPTDNRVAVQFIIKK